MDGYDLWLKIPRGAIEDYGDYQEWLADGDVENYAEFEDMWRAEYPDEFVWCNFTAIEIKDIGCRLIFLGQKLIPVIYSPVCSGDSKHSFTKISRSSSHWASSHKLTKFSCSLIKMENIDDVRIWIVRTSTVMIVIICF